MRHFQHSGISSEAGHHCFSESSQPSPQPCPRFATAIPGTDAACTATAINSRLFRIFDKFIQSLGKSPARETPGSGGIITLPLEWIDTTGLKYHLFHYFHAIIPHPPKWIQLQNAMNGSKATDIEIRPKASSESQRRTSAKFKQRP